MVLSEKQKEELNRAVLDYLNSNGYSEATAALETGFGTIVCLLSTDLW